MTTTLQQQIVDALLAKPDQKAVDLARALNADRTEINRILYGPLRRLVTQDRLYRWSVVQRGATNRTVDNDVAPPVANTDLARICRYYLSCLGYDDAGISTFQTSKFGDPDYFEIDSLPRSSNDLSDRDAAKKLLGRKRSEQGRYGLYLSYPTSLRLIQSKRSSWEGFMVEPILLFPIEHDGVGGQLTIDLNFPIINQRALQALSNVDRDELMNEFVQLEQELGLGHEDSRVDIDEIALRLQSVRPEWPWREQIDADRIGKGTTPFSQLTEPGIYNRAVILMAEKSPFTQGLEKELRDLSTLPESSYKNTALGRWLDSHATVPQPRQLTEPLIEVLPMNSEQRQAVASALTRPITIITGPPGTGKSQVVTNLLINAAWSGKRVLLASKNNKAVDVVETRVNALGPRPILLRLGAQSYQLRLAEYVLALLSSVTTDTEREEFTEAKNAHERIVGELRGIAAETQRFVDRRNDVDRLEQEAEEPRRRLGDELFVRCADVDQVVLRDQCRDLSNAINAADKNKVGFLTRLVWPLVKSGRFAALNQAIESAGKPFRDVGVGIPQLTDDQQGIDATRDALEFAIETLADIDVAVGYLNALRALQACRSLEEIAREEVSLLDRIARSSQMLWKLWLRLQPSVISAPERQNLGKYTAILKMVIEAGAEGQLSKVAYLKFGDLQRSISHLLPCWAVTSLSARGRIPFEAGHFDIVVFDEASQCDIASALPLLYRAKSVVIIGDPKQLSHISGLRKGQDQALLERHGLIDEYPHWAYSHQSLFGLGSTQVSGADIVSLVDHHRSHADVISFSNKEFYEQRLRVATRYDNLKSPNRKEPGVRWVDVKGNVVRPANGGAVNATEARAVVETLRDLVLSKGYEGSIGVVTPFRAQANAITEAVNRDEKLTSALLRRGFLADTVHKFQGDERDVMIFSSVVSAGTPGGALGFLRSNGNLFNVAITRARAQLIVVGDMTACGASDVDYLSRFAAYTASLEKQNQEVIAARTSEYGPVYPVVAEPERVSDWERTFYSAAYQAGFRLIPQHPVEKYAADFLMLDGERKLVVEIDGERYHRNWTGELCRRDQIRNQRMFELGYDVMRFWVYEVRDDIEGCLSKLSAWQKNSAIRDPKTY